MFVRHRLARFWCLAWSCLAFAACGGEEPFEDPYAGIVGATLLSDGAIVVLPSGPIDASTQQTVTPVQTGDGSAAPPSGGASEPVGNGTGGACDLTGRWLITERVVVVGLGVRQASLNWRYYEIKQSGDQIVVQRGVSCGGKVVPIDPLGELGEFAGVWPHMQRDVRADGRTGMSKASGSGCAVSFARHWEVISASPHYAQNPTTPLPKVSEKAAGATPGWLDGDNDGKPGFGSKMTGLVTGTVHVAQRRRSDWSGNIAASAAKFRLLSDWNIEVTTLAIDGSELLATESSRDPEPSGHFAAFVKLADGQAAGSDETAICAEIRKLSPMLSPEANK